MYIGCPGPRRRLVSTPTLGSSRGHRRTKNALGYPGPNLGIEQGAAVGRKHTKDSWAQTWRSSRGPQQKRRPDSTPTSGSSRGHGGPRTRRPGWTLTWGSNRGRGEPRMAPGFDPNLRVVPGPRRSSKGARTQSQLGGRARAAAGRKRRPDATTILGSSRGRGRRPDSTLISGSNRGRGGPEHKTTHGLDPNLRVESWAGAGRKRVPDPQLGGRTGAAAGRTRRPDSTPTWGSNRGRGGLLHKRRPTSNLTWGVKVGPLRAANGARIRPRLEGRTGAAAGR